MVFLEDCLRTELEAADRLLVEVVKVVERSRSSRADYLKGCRAY